MGDWDGAPSGGGGAVAGLTECTEPSTHGCVTERSRAKGTAGSYGLLGFVPATANDKTLFLSSKRCGRAWDGQQVAKEGRT